MEQTIKVINEALEKLKIVETNIDRLWRDKIISNTNYSMREIKKIIWKVKLLGERLNGINKK